MTDDIPADTKIESILGQPITFNGSEWRITRSIKGDKVTYTAELLDDDVENVPDDYQHSHTQTHIGCPDCKQNTYAQFTRNHQYECPCGYRNDVTIGTLLLP